MQKAQKMLNNPTTSKSEEKKGARNSTLTHQKHFVLVWSGILHIGGILFSILFKVMPQSNLGSYLCLVKTSAL